MRARRVLDGRCPGCRLQPRLCICADMPLLPTRTRVVLILHQLELHKTTNTGRLALRCLPNSAVALRGRDTTLRPAGAAPTPPIPDRPLLEPASGWLAQ